MREILFRGKRLDNGEWAHGNLVCWQDGTASIDDGSYDMPQWSIDPATVGQYTGLTDKNGKKIFEGDIVESAFTKKPYIVCFGEYTYTNEYGEEESVCGWYNVEKGGYVTGFGFAHAWATVIGNIHDNPELLEVEKCD